MPRSSPLLSLVRSLNPRWQRASALCSTPALLCALALACNATGCRRTPSPAPPAKSEKPQAPAVAPAAPPAIEPDAVDLFAFGRQLGAIAPCGCTADPLGGLQYAFGYIEQHSAPTRRALLQGGSFLFPDPNGPNAAKDPAEWGQIEERAKLLTSAFTSFGPQLHLGVGPTDFSSPAGSGALQRFSAPRTAANLTAKATPAFTPWQTMNLGLGLTAGVTHVVDPALATDAAAMPKPTDPVAALEALLPKMRAQGHDLILVTAQGERAFAQALAQRVSGIDILVVTGPIHNLETARLGGAPARVNDTWIIEPGDQAQTISHLRLFVPKAALDAAKADPKADAIGPASTWTLLASHRQRSEQIARLQTRLTTFERDPDAEPAFLERMRRELQSLQRPQTRPTDRVALRIEAAKVSCHGTAAPAIQQKLKDYDQWVAKANKTRFTGVFAPKPAQGQPSYVGDKVCSGCHATAVAFWKKTHHAAAFATLEQANKEYDLNCVSCHVTGYRKPGGSELVENHKLRNVQCEQCHGPGSAHAKSADKTLITRKVPEALCKGCHTPEHSDTFEYTAYLRDVLGTGHGQAARKALGEGPTGHQLRQAALKKAGGSCK